MKSPDSLWVPGLDSITVFASVVLQGHTGCVNTIAWNASGSLLVSGSDDTRVNVWDYGSRRLLYSVDSGHSANIFCTKFMPQCNGKPDGSL